jgi:hypothetical protein
MRRTSCGCVVVGLPDLRSGLVSGGLRLHYNYRTIRRMSMRCAILVARAAGGTILD